MKFVILILIIIIYYLLFSNKNIQIVVSRYNEDLKWLNNKPFRDLSVVVYNKGINDNFYKSSNTCKIENIKNVGRESHTYLYHIINNYDNLADVTVFLPGSADMDNKYQRSVDLVNNVKKHNNTVFLGENFDLDHIYNFQIENYSSTNESNFNLNKENQLEKANIRPFGKWYKHHFSKVDDKNQIISYCAIIAISKKDIRQYPISYYQSLLEQLNNSSNPEVAHYFERSWYAVFYPYNNVKKIYLLK